MRRATFGKLPAGERLAKILNSPNFRDGQFRNTHHTPQLVEGASMLGVAYKFFFKKSPRRRPVSAIPSIRTNLKTLPPGSDLLVWFGHSSYLLQLAGKTILVDPVFSGNASPVAGTNRAFKGADAYTVDELPHIDYLIITHDHYDHLDYKTIVRLRAKTGAVICGLGVAAHFEYWGWAGEKIVEMVWHERHAAEENLTVHSLPARHFSGRGLSPNKTLWMSFLLQTPDLKIYLGGDSGYDTHFADIGRSCGPIDLAILENGQYDEAWRFIHALPEEVLQAAKDLRARRLLPVHSSKFKLANHDWDEPLMRITENNKDFGIPLVTPMIGEIVRLRDEKQEFRAWWARVD